MGESTFGRAFYVGEVLIGMLLAEQSTDAERAERMLRVVDEKKHQARTVYPDLGEDGFSSESLSTLLEAEPESVRLRLWLTHRCDDPFDPHELHYSRKEIDTAFVGLLSRLGASNDLARSIDKALRAAPSATTSDGASVLRKIRHFAPLGLVAGAVTGLAAAPLLAMYIGASAGLVGAAAIAHGFAAIGGGSLVVGGGGMVGGVLAATAGGSVAGVGTVVGAALLNLDQEAYELELRIEGALFHLLIVQRGEPASSAMPWIAAIETRVGELEGLLAEERRFSDPGAAPILRIERRIGQLRQLAAWMLDQAKRQL